jgi:hypothetical protein
VPNLFHVNIDLSDLKDFGPQFQATVEKEMLGAVNRLTAMTHAHIVEEANKKLHTRRQMFLDAISWYSDREGKFFVINLDASARWIDDGMKPHNMLDDLLKSDKAKTAKDGSKYLVVPFEHGGGVTQNTPWQMDLLREVRREMKMRQIPYKKIERNGDGSPKIGLLHTFDINDQPPKTKDGPGQGWGPVGAVRQGWFAGAKGPPTDGGDRADGTPFLQGLRVYQKWGKGKKGEPIVKRAIMTFRVASSKHKDQEGRWDHPGLGPLNIFDEAADWAKTTWEKEVAPNVLSKLLVSVT